MTISMMNEDILKEAFKAGFNACADYTASTWDRRYLKDNKIDDIEFDKFYTSIKDKKDVLGRV